MAKTDAPTNNGEENNGEEIPLLVAIVGSGPSGFYAAEALLRSGRNIHVTMIEKLPTPFGLVRSGIAPDHPKLKQTARVYDKISRETGFEFLGNVTVGKDVSTSDLQATHHAVIFACGAQRDRSMDIPGEDLCGSHTATEFVGWYNGHPDFRDHTFDLSQKVAVIVGHGNVAADVCRILAKPVQDLRTTDIAQHALDALEKSQIEEIYLIGRRGPAQAKFTPKELRELGDIPGVSIKLDPQDCKLSESCELELADANNTAAVKNVDLFRSFAVTSDEDNTRKIIFRFFLGPTQVHGQQRVSGITCSHNDLVGSPFSQQVRPNATREHIPCGLIFRSIGYRGIPIEGVPFDSNRSVASHERGKIIDDGHQIAGLYVTGWYKRGATGIIGTNRADSIETVESLLSDFDGVRHTPKQGIKGLRAQLKDRGVQSVDIAGWQAIDAAEIKQGEKSRKPREKFTRIDDMLNWVAALKR